MRIDIASASRFFVRIVNSRLMVELTRRKTADFCTEVNGLARVSLIESISLEWGGQAAPLSRTSMTV